MTFPVCPHAATARHSNNANRTIALQGLSFISGIRPSGEMSSIESFWYFYFGPKQHWRQRGYEHTTSWVAVRRAEREGFSQSRLAQVPLNTTLGDNNQYLCGLQALS